MLSRFLEWERALWGKSKKPEQERIAELRAIFNKGSLNDYRGQYELILGEVLDLTHLVTDRLD